MGEILAVPPGTVKAGEAGAVPVKVFARSTRCS